MTIFAGYCRQINSCDRRKCRKEAIHTLAGARVITRRRKRQCLVSVSGRVICRNRLLANGVSIPVEIECTFGADHQTTALLGALVYRLNDVDQLLLVLQHPVQLVVVSCAEIAHHMLVAVEEHDRHPVVKFIHLVEVWDLIEVA